MEISSGEKENFKYLSRLRSTVEHGENYSSKLYWRSGWLENYSSKLHWRSGRLFTAEFSLAQ